jgi:hypothetical protein
MATATSTAGETEMTGMQYQNRSIKVVATLGMVLMMAFFSACDILATEGARDAIAGGREIREFEDENLRPIEDEMNDLWVNEIEPREREIEDLRHEMQTAQDDLLGPLWDIQNDVWAPGGEASVAQAEFEERYRALEVAQKEIELEQRDLDSRWQVLWAAPGVDPEYQELEDLRFEKQRELDRMYRFGNRPIDELWDEINELNAAHGWANTDSQIESERINAQLRDLYDLQQEVQNSGSDEANALWDKANGVQNQLNDLYNFGWDPINNIYFEIEQLENEQNSSDATTSSSGSLTIEIIDLQNLSASYGAIRDAEIAVLNAQLEALQVVVVTDADGNPVETDAAGNVIDTTDSDARIVELEGLIAGLEADAEVLVAAKNAEKDDLVDQIVAKKASYDQLIEDAEADFLIVSADLLAGAAEVKEQIDALEAIGGDDADAQIALLQPSYDGAIAAEQVAEDEFHEVVAQYELERDSGVDELEVLKEAVEAELLEGVTGDIDAQIADYQTELDSLRDGAERTAVETTVETTIVDTEAADAIRAEITTVETNWGVLIAELNNKIAILESDLGTTSAGVDNSDRIHSLRLQAEEMERQLQSDISDLESLVHELYRQADEANSGDSGRHAEIQNSIDELNDQLQAIWDRDSSKGLEILLQVQALEKQVRVLQEEQEELQYALEEELWDLDDKLSLFYRDQNNDTQTLEIEFQAEANALQDRRSELDELRWAIDDEQRVVFDEINDKQNDANEQIRLIESEQLGALKDKMVVLEGELRVLYEQRRDLENKLRDAEALVEEKKRELEDKVFDALESAAGTVDEAGDTVLTATEESGTDTAGIDEGDTADVDPVGAAN